jgi:Kef-type K+ transport system membrane component KefB
LLGLGLGLFLYPRLYSAGGSGVFPTALFMGAAMSITAFPVLARILIEGKLHKTRIGTIALACAAVADATAWCGLAFVVAIVRSANLWPAAFTIVKVLAFVALMFWVVRPMLRKLETYYDRTGQLSQNVMAIVFILLLASAWTTEAIGIHALFGAFLMGTMMPKRMSFVLAIRQKLEDLIVVFLLPLFFAYTGLRTEISLLNTAALWGYAGLIILVSCLGKFGGSTLAGRAVGLGWRESSAIGILMNTRGLMELVILNIGKDIGVINRPVFAMMVMMAILTTLLTTPILRWVYPQRVAVLGAQQSAPVEAAALSSGG